MNGIVLAGGLSTRMGRDKASLPWEGSDLLHTVLGRLEPVCEKLIVVSNISRVIKLPDVTVVADYYPQCGPLAGMHAGLLASDQEYNFFVACDMPFVNAAAVQFMQEAAVGYDAVVPYIDGYYHPLHAVYHKNCLPFIERMLAEGNYRVLDFYHEVKLRRISKEELVRHSADLKMLVNVNTLAEFQEICNAVK